MNLKIRPEAEDDLERSYLLSMQIKEKIQKAQGWLRFDLYMREVLYAPNLGYYSSQSRKIGFSEKDGSDFITAPELSILFAQSLIPSITAVFNASNTCEILEIGAGTGVLAAQLLEMLGQKCMRYIIVEVSSELKKRQHHTLTEKAPIFLDKVHWLEEIPNAFEGVILANEVLDAMPVRLFSRQFGQWFERGVTVKIDSHLFEWKDQEIDFKDSEENTDVFNCLKKIEGSSDYVTEIHQAALTWMRTLSKKLKKGILLLIDYGFPEREYYHNQRIQGTLMCHYRHQMHIDPLVYPGLQDITAHVNFSSVSKTAIESGMQIIGYTSQARFLINSGLLDRLMDMDPSNPKVFLPMANAVHKLVSEAEMGELFKVIGMGRGIDPNVLDFAFSEGNRSQSL